jgi:hypothetical protein
MDPTEMRRLFDLVLDRMVEAGWLVSYTFTEGKGYWRNWSEAGWDRIARLRRIVEAHTLTNDDRSPVAFYELAKGRSFPDATLAMKLDPDVLAYFAESVDQLGLAGEDELLVLVQVTLWD